MNSKLLTLATMLVLMVFSNDAAAADTLFDVKAALNRQVDAWNAGDLERAMESYWNSPEMLWISRAGVEKGYQPVLQGYRKDFVDKTRMGVYSYEPLHIEKLSKTAVLYVFRWKIEVDGKKKWAVFHHKSGKR